MGYHRFNDIERGLPRISRTMLSKRLVALVRSGVIEKHTGATPRSTSHHLSAAGQELVPVIVAFGEWGARWAFGEPEADELDPLLLLWWMRGRVNHEALPPERTVVHIVFRGQARSSYWLVLEPGDASLCLRDPGFEADLRMAADLSAMYRVWAGWMEWSDALADERVRLEGPTGLRRAFPRWFALSPLAGAVRSACTNASPTA